MWLDEGCKPMACWTGHMGVKERPCDWMRDVWFVGPASGVLKRDHVVE